ncbi:hypothetical protein Tco_0415167 [Tanacetum coccineum]
MLKRCEDTNLSLNWEKSHFMVKEGIVLGHKISKSGLEVDRAKCEVKLTPSTDFMSKVSVVPWDTPVFLPTISFRTSQKIARPMDSFGLKGGPPFFFSEGVSIPNTLNEIGLRLDLNATDWDFAL